MAVQPIRNEMLINGTWTDVTAYTRGLDTANVSITRGSSSEQTALSSSTCDFTLNNRDGRFSNRNPLSPYFGLIGRGVQFRSGMTGLDKHVRMIDASNTDGTYDGARITTTDKAALDITGDIDIRFEGDAQDWAGVNGHVLAGKYVITGDQRSWIFFVGEDGFPGIWWSSDGTSGNRIRVNSSVAPALVGRAALRVTIDVNNGLGGYTVTFYTSDSISGTWTQISQTVTTGGTTAVFASTALLEVGDFENGGGRGTAIDGLFPFVGRIYGFQLYNGIGGSKVADLSVSGRSRGDTSWSDGLGNTWTCQASAIVDDEDYRFWGQIDRLPQKWDSTGTDVYVPVQAGDILQRLAGNKPLKSPIYRNLSRYTLDQWNTCEDGSSATTLGAAAGNSGTFTNVSLTSDADLLGASGVLSFSADAGYAQASTVTNSNTGVAFWLWYFKLNAVPAGTIEPLYVYYTGGTLYRVALSVGLTTWTVTATKRDGTVIGSSGTIFGAGVLPNAWVAMRLLLTQNGTGIDYEWAWYPIGGAVFFGTSGTWASATCGRPRSWLSPSFTGKSGMRMAHVVLNRADVAFADYTFKSSTNAYINEDPTTRVLRLAGEENVPFFVRGRFNHGPAMGPQDTSKLVDLWQECADVTGAILTTPRDKYGVLMRPVSGYAGRPTAAVPEFSYTSNHLSGQLDPDEVTSGIVNDVTASKPSGTFRRYVKTSGALNANDPTDDPNGVGTRDQPVTRNVYSDDDLLTQAQWDVAVGTWDELRYPTVELNLARAPFTTSTALTNAATRLDLGDAFTLADLPAWLPPEDVSQIVRGYTETYDNVLRVITLNCTPYGPYNFARYTSASLGAGGINPRRYTSSDSTLTASYAAGVSPIQISTVSYGNRWSLTTAPFDAVAGAPVGVDAPGERMSVLWVSNSGSIAALEGGFETGITGWTGSGTMTLTQDSTQFHAGTKSIKGVVAGSPSTASILNSTQVTVSPTTSYTATIWIYTTTSVANINVIITWYTSGGVFISNSVGTAATVNGVWTKFTVTATSPGTAGLARYGVIITGSPATGTTIYGDDFDLVKTANDSTSLGPYVQNLYVTRAVNGIAMTLPSGGNVYVFDRFPWGRP